jgi:hypothetical protein
MVRTVRVLARLKHYSTVSTESTQVLAGRYSTRILRNYSSTVQVYQECTPVLEYCNVVIVLQYY